MGELLWDQFSDGPRLGGAAANVAYHAARAGAESYLISRVGRDTWGQRALRLLALNHVDVSHIGIDRNFPTGQVEVELVAGQPRFRIRMGAAWDHIESNSANRSLLMSADAICLGTLGQRTPLMQTQISHLLRAISRKGAVSVLGGAAARRPLLLFDLNLRPPHTGWEAIMSVLPFADVIKLNEQEYNWLTQACAPRDPIDFLLSQGPAQLVALTKGEQGASLFARHIQCHLPGNAVSGGDPVGAGDAFFAHMALALVQRRPLPEVLERANREAAWVASQAGAMPGLVSR